MEIRERKPSKSARKRDHLALQDLGEALIGLRPSELDALPLDERLREAVLEARRLRARGALRRQRQLIGKLMRTADADAIRSSLARLAEGDRRTTHLLHRAEAWRERICAEGTTAIVAFATATGADTEALRRLADELAASGDENRHRLLKRRLFRELHGILSRSAETAAG